MMAHRRSAGFGMLEVLVALVLIVSVGVTIIAWVQGSVASVIRMRSLTEELQGGQILLEWAKTLNPAARPQGRVDLAGYRVEWSSSVVFHPVPQSGFPDGIGSHDVGLYLVSIKMFRALETTPWITEELELAGYVKKRDPVNPFGF